VGNELILTNRGLGSWMIEIYNPNKILDTVKGYLVITKDHHTIFEEPSLKTTLLSVPSQNVAWVKLIK